MPPLSHIHTKDIVEKKKLIHPIYHALIYLDLASISVSVMYIHERTLLGYDLPHINWDKMSFLATKKIILALNMRCLDIQHGNSEK